MVLESLPISLIHSLRKMWADMGYQGQQLKDTIHQTFDIDLEIVKRPPKRFWIGPDTPIDALPEIEEGFKVQPKRWVVERTFGWLNRWRRLSKEYDLLTSSSESYIYLAMSWLILKRSDS